MVLSLERASLVALQVLTERREIWSSCGTNEEKGSQKKLSIDRSALSVALCGAKGKDTLPCMLGPFQHVSGADRAR